MFKYLTQLCKMVIIEEQVKAAGFKVRLCTMVVTPFNCSGV